MIHIKYNTLFFGGAGEIRILARCIKPPNDLAGRPLQPLEYCSMEI